MNMNIKPPTISVIMSVYNSEKTISKSIESIINQTFEDFQFLIMDDASTESTSEILKQFSNSDKRIRLFKNQKNIGLTKSLNLLIKQVNSNYIARQDADDVSNKNRLSYQYKFLENSNFEGCSTRAIVKNSQRKIPGFSFYLPLKWVIKFKNPVIHGSLMIKKKTLNDLGNYNEKFYYSQDYKLIFDLINNNKNFKILNKVLYELNMEDNISTKYRKEQAYFSKQVKKL